MLSFYMFSALAELGEAREKNKIKLEEIREAYIKCLKYPRKKKKRIKKDLILSYSIFSHFENFYTF